MAGSISIGIVSPGAAIIEDGTVRRSVPGHIWFTVTDSNGASNSYGLEPRVNFPIQELATRTGG